MSFSARPLLLAAALATSALTLAACSPSSREEPGQATTDEKVIGVNLGYRDMSVRPGDDFEAYANGGWRKATEIPAERASIGVGYEVFLRGEARNRELVENAGKDNPAAGTPLRLIADYHAAFMDEAGIEARGMAPLQPRLGRIATIADKAGLAKALGAQLRADVDPLNATNFETENLFGLFVAQGLEDPTRYTPYLLQGGLGMPDREYYLSADKEMAGTRTAYRAYVENVLRAAGVQDAAARAERIVALERKIAAAHSTRAENDDIHKANNLWKIEELGRTAPGLDWPAFLEAAGLSGQKQLIAWHAAPIRKLSGLVASEPIEAWKDWMIFHEINQAAPYLPKRIADLSFGFYGTELTGATAQRERWKRGLTFVNEHLGDAVGKIYAQRYFPPAAKAEVEGMVKNIIAAFDRRVDALDWMAPETKTEAKRKIATLRVGVGYPERWRNYAGLEVKRDDPAGNAWRAKQWEYRYQLAKLGREVDRDEWWMTPQTVNAVNLPLQNAMNFPAAILEAPYFNPKADAAANYGAIGAVIGHEISHSFDNLGAEFDSTGRLRNWWTPADQAHFKAAGQKLVAQYNAYEPLPGLHINGELTLGENIADVAGLAAAYDAYRMSLNGKEAPVIEGLSGDQRFFLAFAQAWRNKMRDATLRQRVLTDGHSPHRERAQTVRNIDAWYAAYGVKPGEKMYLAPRDRVKIW
jgi:putative endopeptidase